MNICLYFSRFSPIGLAFNLPDPNVKKPKSMEQLARFFESQSQRALYAKVALLVLLTLLAGFINWHESAHCIY